MKSVMTEFHFAASASGSVCVDTVIVKCDGTLDQSYQRHINNTNI